MHRHAGAKQRTSKRTTQRTAAARAPVKSLLSRQISTTAAHRPTRKLAVVVPSAPRRFNAAAAATIVPKEGEALPAGYFKVTVDGKEIGVPKGFTVFQAAEAAGATIPRFCYQERLSIAGNCRMCLVEVERVPKPVASCAYPLMDGMKIKTDTPMVKQAREGVLEFILANHPLDCPICDQAGECDLQEQTMHYGSDRSRFREAKRSVEDKYIGPVIKTVMTRCINCTRCVRFAEEVAGVPTLGVTGRGNNAEIGTYVKKVFDSELSGNAVDLCPVGALTNQQYEFKARPWELEHTHSIDVFDAIGSNIRLDSRGTSVLRALPRLHDGVNEEWVSDKARMSVDGLSHQRIDTPLVRNAQGGYEKKTWGEVLTTLHHKFSALKIVNPDNDIQAIVGDLADAESIMVTKDLINNLGSSNTVFADGLDISADVRSHYLFNTTISNLDDSDCVVLIGTNPRMEAPILNARIRKQTFNRRIPVYGVGPEADLAMDHLKWVGNDSNTIEDILNGKSPIAAKLKAAKKPVVIFGMSMFNQLGDTQDKQPLQLMERFKNTFASTWSDDWKGINVLQTSAARVAALDLGFVPGPDVDLTQKPKVVFLVGADTKYVEEQFKQKDPNQLIIYQGSHGDIGARVADIILPSTAYSEKHSTYVNTEGRVQKTNKAVGNKHLAQDDWRILRAVGESLGVVLGYNNTAELHQRLAHVSPTFASLDTIESSKLDLVEERNAANAKPAAPFKIQAYLDNHFMTNAISRASPTMAQLAKELPVSRNSYKQ